MELEENNKKKCECKTLTTTTVINDIDNIISNSKADKVFSDEGL